jgi:uncharacterized circularly permuted ATP-grasp superfamily protein/uncharacterized alpha-E superfamily protein
MPEAFAGGLDEMVSGQGRILPHWHGVMGVVGQLGRAALAERGERLARAMAEDGVASLLPGKTLAGSGAWRLDPLPLPLPAAEFEALARGLAQRAQLLDAVLADLYGAQQLLAEGLIPPALVCGSPAFVRAARGSHVAPRRPLLNLYAADLVRGADGVWRVLQDRTALASGLGQVLENRRLLSAAMPEAFQAQAPRSLAPFFELWQQGLARLAPRDRPDPAIAMLTPGTSDAHWFEHVVLSRELGCTLVECGDLTVRGGALFLKTLSGLQPIDVVLSRLDARSLDPLDQPEADAASGVPGLLDAHRHGALTLLNAPGAALAEIPALALYLGHLAHRLLGEDLLLPSLPGHLVGEGPTALPDGSAAWRYRPAGRGEASESGAPRPGEAMIATALPHLSVAPVLEGGSLGPAPVVLRLFAMQDGSGWRVLPGGLARLVGLPVPITGRLPGAGWCKDVWIAADPSEAIVGAAATQRAPLRIRRDAGTIPSRVADNLFWLGRYVERLDRGARLMRATIARLRRGSALPREVAEVAALARCLCEAGLVNRESLPSGGSLTALSRALALLARPAMRQAQDRIGGLIESVRDRLTADMHATFTQTLRTAEDALDAAPDELPELARALIPSLRFAHAVAGVAAENMVRGGGRLFLELGRRIERAQAVATEVAVALDGPPERVEAGLRLILELCDSAITYRTRYLGILQPAPALDLVLADAANPRGLAFQLDGIRAALAEVAGGLADELVEETARLLAVAEAVTPRLLDARDQAREAASLPPMLRELAHEIGALSDRVSRQYFALLPPARAVGVDVALVLDA